METDDGIRLQRVHIGDGKVVAESELFVAKNSSLTAAIRGLVCVVYVENGKRKLAVASPSYMTIGAGRSKGVLVPTGGIQWEQSVDVGIGSLPARLAVSVLGGPAQIFAYSVEGGGEVETTILEHATKHICVRHGGKATASLLWTESGISIITITAGNLAFDTETPLQCESACDAPGCKPLAAATLAARFPSTNHVALQVCAKYVTDKDEAPGEVLARVGPNFQTWSASVYLCKTCHTTHGGKLAVGAATLSDTGDVILRGGVVPKKNAWAVVAVWQKVALVYGLEDRQAHHKVSPGPLVEYGDGKPEEPREWKGVPLTVFCELRQGARLFLERLATSRQGHPRLPAGEHLCGVSVGGTHQRPRITFEEPDHGVHSAEPLEAAAPCDAQQTETTEAPLQEAEADPAAAKTGEEAFFSEFTELIKNTKGATFEMVLYTPPTMNKAQEMCAAAWQQCLQDMGSYGALRPAGAPSYNTFVLFLLHLLSRLPKSIVDKLAAFKTPLNATIVLNETFDEGHASLEPPNAQEASPPTYTAWVPASLGELEDKVKTEEGRLEWLLRFTGMPVLYALLAADGEPFDLRLHETLPRATVVIGKRADPDAALDSHRQVCTRSKSGVPKAMTKWQHEAHTLPLQLLRRIVGVVVGPVDFTRICNHNEHAISTFSELCAMDPTLRVSQCQPKIHAIQLAAGAVQRVDAGGTSVVGYTGHGKSSFINAVVSMYAAEESQPQPQPQPMPQPMPAAQIIKVVNPNTTEDAAQESIENEQAKLQKERDTTKDFCESVFLGRDRASLRRRSAAKYGLLMGLLPSGSAASSTTHVKTSIRNGGDSSVVAVAFKTETEVLMQERQARVRDKGKGAAAPTMGHELLAGEYTGKAVLVGVDNDKQEAFLSVVHRCSGASLLSRCDVHRTLNLATPSVHDCIGEGEVDQMMVTGDDDATCKPLSRIVVTCHKMVKEEGENGAEGSRTATLVNFGKIEHATNGNNGVLWKDFEDGDEEEDYNFETFKTGARKTWPDGVVANPVVAGAVMALLRGQRAKTLKEAAAVHLNLYLSNVSGIYEILHVPYVTAAADLLSQATQGLNMTGIEFSCELTLDELKTSPRFYQRVLRMTQNDGKKDNKALVGTLSKNLLDQGAAPQLPARDSIKFLVDSALVQCNRLALSKGLETLERALESRGPEGDHLFLQLVHATVEEVGSAKDAATGENFFKKIVKRLKHNASKARQHFLEQLARLWATSRVPGDGELKFTFKNNAWKVVGFMEGEEDQEGQALNLFERLGDHFEKQLLCYVVSSPLSAHTVDDLTPGLLQRLLEEQMKQRYDKVLRAVTTTEPADALLREVESVAKMLFFKRPSDMAQVDLLVHPLFVPQTSSALLEVLRQNTMQGVMDMNKMLQGKVEQVCLSEAPYKAVVENAVSPLLAGGSSVAERCAPMEVTLPADAPVLDHAGAVQALAEELDKNDGQQLGEQLAMLGLREDEVVLTGMDGVGDALACVAGLEGGGRFLRAMCMATAACIPPFAAPSFGGWAYRDYFGGLCPVQLGRRLADAQARSDHLETGLTSLATLGPEKEAAALLFEALLVALKTKRGLMLVVSGGVRVLRPRLRVSVPPEAQEIIGKNEALRFLLQKRESEPYRVGPDTGPMAAVLVAGRRAFLVEPKAAQHERRGAGADAGPAPKRARTEEGPGPVTTGAEAMECGGSPSMTKGLLAEQQTQMLLLCEEENEALDLSWFDDF